MHIINKFCIYRAAIILIIYIFKLTFCNLKLAIILYKDSIRICIFDGNIIKVNFII